MGFTHNNNTHQFTRIYNDKHFLHTYLPSYSPYKIFKCTLAVSLHHIYSILLLLLLYSSTSAAYLLHSCSSSDPGSAIHSSINIVSWVNPILKVIMLKHSPANVRWPWLTHSDTYGLINVAVVALDVYSISILLVSGFGKIGDTQDTHHWLFSPAQNNTDDDCSLQTRRRPTDSRSVILHIVYLAVGSLSLFDYIIVPIISCIIFIASLLTSRHTRTMLIRQ